MKLKFQNKKIDRAKIKNFEQKATKAGKGAGTACGEIDAGTRVPFSRRDHMPRLTLPMGAAPRKKGRKNLNHEAEKGTKGE